MRLLLAGALLTSACNFPKPEGAPGDASGIDASIDAPVLDPSTTVLVSADGDDANDGRAAPVKTLKRAIAIAGSNPAIAAISIAAGRYSSESGESFPYTVPEHLIIAGPATGGAVLVGASGVAGLKIASGALHNLDLESFDIAVSATGALNISKVDVRSSKQAIRAEGFSDVTIDQLELIGSTSVCGTGITLVGSAKLSANMLTARALTTTLASGDLSTAEIIKADIAGDSRCPGTHLSISTTKTFVLRDSAVVGGDTGLRLTSGGQATLVGVTLRDMASDAITGGASSLNMTGGQITGTQRFAIEVTGGTWSFTGVQINNNNDAAYIQGSSPSSKGVLVMRNCRITGNNYGIDLYDNSVGDLGTDASPGGNTLQGNLHVGLSMSGASPVQVNAVANVWNPSTQGSGADGRYAPPSTITGEVGAVAGNNYSMFDGWSLRR